MENTLRYSPNAVFIRKSELATAYSFAKGNWLPPIHSQKGIGYRLSLSLLSDSNQRPRDYKSRALAN